MSKYHTQEDKNTGRYQDRWTDRWEGRQGIWKDPMEFWVSAVFTPGALNGSLHLRGHSGWTKDEHLVKRQPAVVVALVQRRTTKTPGETFQNTNVQFISSWRFSFIMYHQIPRKHALKSVLPR